MSPTPVRPRVGLILLAAGDSSRMGLAKQALPYRGRSLLRHAAEVAVGSRCRPVVVVLGAEADRLREEVAGLPIDLVENRGWRDGMGSSIRAGLEAILAGGDPIAAVVVALADQPLVTSEAIDRLVAVHDRTGSERVASSYGGVLGVPALFAGSTFPRLLALRGAEGARGLLVERPEEVARLEMPEASLDVDTPEDYARLRASSDRPPP